MKIQIDPSALAETRWYEYAIRFLFGGLITAAAGIIAKKFGPVIGGLFLAFPAILPASATLIEKHELEKKEGASVKGIVRAAQAVSADAAGAALGSISLAIFAILVWRAMPDHPAWLVLSVATIAWLVIAMLLWRLRKQF